MQADRVAEARDWFARAHRLAPTDLSIGLMFGVTLVRHGSPAEAVPVLRRVADGGGGRAAWIALASAQHAAGHSTDAAASMRIALSRYRLPDDLGFATIADAIADAAGLPGWCGLREDGGLECRSGGKLVTRGLRATVDRQDLLGSPIDLAAIQVCEGVVAVRDGGVAGWAWHPGDPDRDPVLDLCDADGHMLRQIVADTLDLAVADDLRRPRRIAIPAAALHGLAMPIRLRCAGRDLPGSPLDPQAPVRAAVVLAQAVAAAWPLLGAPADSALAQASVPAGLVGPPAFAASQPTRPVAVIVPVYGGATLVQACLASVFATVPAGTKVIVVDDASPEREIVDTLSELQRSKRIRLIRHSENRGFPAACNAGLRAAARLAGTHDVVLLNSDTVVTAGWLADLRALVQEAPDIGTATPLSNDASILSYPKPAPSAANANPILAGPALALLARQAATANRGIAVEIPTGVGFCLYIRNECLRAVGVLREDLFAQGYGEENDFCLRARHLGWRHVGAPGVYVAHVGGQSFGAAAAALISRNLAVLEARYPGYHTLIAAFQAEDPLAAARCRLDAVRWRDGRGSVERGSVERGSAKRGRGKARQAVLLVTHDSGGGVERVVQERCTQLRAEGIRPILLRPARDRDGRLVADCCAVSDDQMLTPNLRFALPEALPELLDLLKADGITAMDVHHLLGHHHMVLRLAAMLGIPTDFHIHDYAMICPRITFFGVGGRYCGEPARTAVCDACVADLGRVIEEDIPTTSLRARSANDLAGARRVVAPSNDAATRLRRHFPGLSVDVAALEDDRLTPDVQVPPQGARRRVVVIGAIGPEKGYDLLLGCARDAEARNLALEFCLVGHSMDDARLLETKRVFITGRYAEAEAIALIEAQRGQLAWLPSIWPETWCFTLGLAWQARLPVVAFDIGAQAERIRNNGQGWVLPLGLAPASINNTLITLERAVN